jgi:sarcosine oxidase subunit alpha
MEAWLRDRVDRLSLGAHVVDLTADRGAIVLAGPAAREVLGALTTDPIDRDAFPHLGVRELTVADVPCGAIRTGFVGEVSFELHHPRSRGPELWRAIAEAGAAHGFHPHGLDVLEVLRLEKGHVYMGQDSLPDDTPAKLGLGWAVAGSDTFVGRRAVERLAALPLERKLVGLEFDRGGSELRGVPLRAGDAIVGRVTSAARSPVMDRAIGLGWIRRDREEGFPDELLAGRARARVVSTPFYDPEGERVRA